MLLVRESVSEYTKEQLESEEFLMLKGTWKITEYLGKAVEVKGIEAEEYQENNEETDCDINNEYLGRVFNIEMRHIMLFCPSSEFGYDIEDFNTLFMVFRQPMELDITPPFTCVSIRFKDDDICYDFIIDSSGKVLLSAKNHFYKLEKE